MAATLCVSGHAAKGRAQIDLDNWDADEAVTVTRVDLVLVDKERTETFTLPREIRVEPDCDEHIDVTDALKNLVVENGESHVRVTVKGSPNYAISQREGIFVVARQRQVQLFRL
jgi:hypothetical protein